MLIMSLPKKKKKNDAYYDYATFNFDVAVRHNFAVAVVFLSDTNGQIIWIVMTSRLPSLSVNVRKAHAVSLSFLNGSLSSSY